MKVRGPDCNDNQIGVGSSTPIGAKSIPKARMAKRLSAAGMEALFLNHGVDQIVSSCEINQMAFAVQSAVMRSA